MEDLTKNTPTELLKMINDAKLSHDLLKREIINDTMLVSELEEKINKKLEKLTELEKSYVELIEELSKRKDVIR
jgi:hypothetical protein